jgi:PAS domain S-box-containing protein
MSVRVKTLIILCLTFLITLGILYFIAQWFLLRDAIVAEQYTTTRDVTRLQAALNDQIAVMDAIVSDWAPWDDTYAFINTADPGYIKSNLPNSEAFTSIGVELMLFINNSGQIVYGKMVDLESGAEIPIPESLTSQLKVDSPLLSHKNPSDKRDGILSLPEGLMIIASQPILTSQGQGPIRGTLIMGRRLDQAEISKISNNTQLSISAFPLRDVLPEDVALAHKSLVGVNPIFVAPESNTVVSGYTLINDIYGNPALIFRVEAPREAIAQARTSVRTLGLALLTIGIILGLTTIFALDSMVVRRLINLNASVLKIGSQGTALSRVEVNGRDEIFALANSVNSMLDSLENSRANERESGERFRSLYEDATIGIYRTTPDGHILMANPALIRMLGYASLEELSQRDLAVEGYELGHPRLEFKQQIEQFGEVRGLESAWKCKDSSTVYVRESAHATFDENNQPLFYEGTVEDITDRKKAEQELKKYSEHLEELVDARTRELHEAQEQLVRKEKLAVLGQLAGSVGHELRNPLGVINTSIYYLEMVQPDANQKIKQHHAMIEQEVHNADKIISDLLDFARGVSAEREKVSAAELVNKTLERFHVPASIELNLDLPGDLPELFVDPRQIEQVLGNLTVNACQAMTASLTYNNQTSATLKDGGKLTISASWQKQMVAIAVKDTGTGITAENMKKLFEPLFTTKVKGIGLGLAVSRKLAEANEGRIEVESQVGQGSTFTLYLSVLSSEVGG